MTAKIEKDNKFEMCSGDITKIIHWVNCWWKANMNNDIPEDLQENLMWALHDEEPLDAKVDGCHLQIG